MQKYKMDRSSAFSRFIYTIVEEINTSAIELVHHNTKFQKTIDTSLLNSP